MELEEITNERLTEVTNLLKSYIPNWVEDIRKAISADKEWKAQIKKKCSRSMAYNLSSGVILSQFRRRIFVQCAMELLKDISVKVDKVTEELNVVQTQ